MDGVTSWSGECMLDSWSKLAATQGRALATAGRFQEARGDSRDEEFAAVAYYLPPMPERRDNRPPGTIQQNDRAYQLGDKKAMLQLSE